MNITVNVSELQFKTLEKLRLKNIKAGNFIRQEIAGKIKQEYSQLIEIPKYKCLF